MFSLMERMEKHYTSYDANLVDEHFLDEALQNGHLKPVSWLSVTEDQSVKKKILSIVILPLYPQDVKRIKSTMPYSMDSKCIEYKDAQGNIGVSFYRYIPLKEPRKKAVGQDQDTQDDVQQDTAADVQAATSAPQPQPKKGGLMAKLAAKKSAQQAQPTNDDDTLTEGLLKKLQGAGNAPQAQGTPTGGDGSQPQVAKTDDLVDSEVYKWLKTYYMGIVSIIEQNQSYDRGAIDNLKNIDNLYNKYLSTPASSDKIYVEKSTDELKSDIAKAIADGTWSDVLRAKINPLNLESLVFGNVLSVRNQNAVISRARDFGIQFNDPNYPTLILAPKAWMTYLKRRVVDNPQMQYPMVVPLATQRGSQKKDTGTKGHYESFGTNIDGFTTVYGYDISDTEPLDPNAPDLVQDLPGIINNLTGTLNQSAIDFTAAAEAEKAANLTDEQKAVLEESKTDDGQARIFNRALVSYVNQFKLGISLNDVENATDAVSAYAQNILAITKKTVEMSGYNNPDIVNPMSVIAAFGVGCYTIGSDQILQRSNGALGYNPNLKGEWDKNADKVISIISDLIRFIYNYLNAAYSRIGDDTDGANDSQQPVVVAVPQTADGAPAALNESIEQTIENLLENF